MIAAEQMSAAFAVMLPPDMPQTLRSPASSDLLIKKSRFIGCVQPMTDRSSAQAVVEALRREHPGAAHVCWALLAGGQSAAVDDGEPSGTAGRPMLDVLRHQDLEGVLATVVRYFGGVKLGARFVLPLPPKQKGVRVEPHVIDLAALREELQQSLQWGATTPESLELESGYQGAAYVRVTTSRPDFVLQQLVPVAQRLGARAYFGVHEVDELALAVRRLMADVREVRV